MSTRADMVAIRQEPQKLAGLHRYLPPNRCPMQLTCPGRKLPPLLRSVSTSLSPLSPCKPTNTLPVQPQPGRDEVYTTTCRVGRDEQADAEEGWG